MRYGPHVLAVPEARVAGRFRYHYLISVVGEVGEVGDSAGVRIFEYEGGLPNTKPIS